MAFKWPPKDPNEVLDYEHDWEPRLDVGDAIAPPAEALVDEGDVVIQSTALDGNVQRVWLSGGTVKDSGDPEKLTLRITTVAGRVLDEGILVPIRSR